MISQTINRPLLCNFLLQDFLLFMYVANFSDFEDSYLERTEQLYDPKGRTTQINCIREMVDTFLQIFDGETVSEVQKNINDVLTASKHLLTYHKQDLIWFQKSLSRMKNVRNAFKNQ